MNDTLEGHRARRRFGQNFLVDTSVIAGIVAAVGPVAGDHMVEIGPGLGALTLPLLQTAARLTVIEIDRDLAARLVARFEHETRFRLVLADALTVDLGALATPGERLRLVGNLPYNISTPLLLHALAHAASIHDLHVMVQREVAERLAAAPGGGDYGRLSIACQASCEVHSLLDVPPESFEPAPSIFSSVVRLVPRPTLPSAAVLHRLGQITHLAFSQRRKMVRQTLGKHFGAARLEALGIALTARAEEIPVAAYLALAAEPLPA